MRRSSNSRYIALCKSSYIACGPGRNPPGGFSGGVQVARRRAAGERAGCGSARAGGLRPGGRTAGARERAGCGRAVRARRRSFPCRGAAHFHLRARIFGRATEKRQRACRLRLRPPPAAPPPPVRQCRPSRRRRRHLSDFAMSVRAESARTDIAKPELWDPFRARVSGGSPSTCGNLLHLARVRAFCLKWREAASTPPAPNLLHPPATRA